MNTEEKQKQKNPAQYQYDAKLKKLRHINNFYDILNQQRHITRAPVNQAISKAPSYQLSAWQYCNTSTS